MKLFISWSGERSKRVAEIFNEFMKEFLHGTDPFFSPEDIDKGDKWFDSISTQLEKTNFGIICLTKENRNSPWILFESGSLAKNPSISNVCPVLFGIDPSDVDGPLAQFQLTQFAKDEIYKLCMIINNKLEKKLEERIFNKLFDRLWDETEKKIETIVNDNYPQLQISGRTNREILEEIWHQVRRNHYTENLATNDKLIGQLVDGLNEHVATLLANNQSNVVATMRNIFNAVEYLISHITDKQIKESIIAKYEEIHSRINAL